MAEVPSEARRFKGTTRERVRRGLVALLERALRDDKQAVSVTELKAEVGGDTTALTTLLRLWRAGEWSVADSWGDALPEPAGPAKDHRRQSLEAMIREAHGSDGAREAALHELGALVIAGVVATDEANVVRASLGEARQAAEKRREVEPAPEEAERMLMVGEREAKAAESIFLMVSDARRDRLFALIDAELAADCAEHPNVDALGPGR